LCRIRRLSAGEVRIVMSDSVQSSDTWVENSFVVRRAHSVSGASVIGLWLLLPFAILGAAYLICALIVILFHGDQLEALYPVGLSVIATTAHWCWIARRVGREWTFGLWALIPVVGLFPTFVLAREAVGNEWRSGVPRDTGFCISCGLARTPGGQFCRGCGTDLSAV